LLGGSMEVMASIARVYMSYSLRVYYTG
jgi:hypothetical protein